MNLTAADTQLNVNEWLDDYEGRVVDIDYTDRFNLFDAVDAMDYAAGDGRLDVVKWLHDNRTEGCSIWAMNLAAENGHLDVFEFLYKNKKPYTKNDYSLKLIRNIETKDAKVIQEGCENWLWKPTCSDGTIGIHPRLLWF